MEVSCNDEHFHTESTFKYYFLYSGCNHMQCFNCKHDFCWMCLGDWKAHGSEYYECSRYKENPNIANESVHAQVRLKGFL